MAVEHNIPKGVIFIGADQVLRVDVTGGDGVTPENMTGWALRFVLRNGAALLIEKATGGQGIVIGDGADTGDRASISLARADTLDIAPGRYDYALWRTDDPNDNPLVFGTLWLTAVARQ